MARTTKKPTFFQQGAMILLPVAVLAGIAFLSIRQDRSMAHQEAAVKAQSATDQLLRLYWTELNSLVPMGTVHNGAWTFEVDASGGLVSPKSVAPTPEPKPMDATLLNSEQRDLWTAARALEISAGPAERGVEAYSQFLKKSPQPDFTAAATYAMALWQAAIPDVDAALSTLQKVTENYPDAVGETGLPLATLAEVKRLLLSKQRLHKNFASEIEVACSNVVNRPTLLTPYHLQLIAGAATLEPERETCKRWQDRWHTDEILRTLHAAWKAQAAKHVDTQKQELASEAGVVRVYDPEWFRTPQPTPSMNTGTFWFESQDWLAIASRSNQTAAVTCYSEENLGSRFKDLLERERLLPNYFSASVSVAGRMVRKLAPDIRTWREAPYMTKGGGGFKQEPVDNPGPEVLASAKQTSNDRELATVTVYLTNAAAAYKAQRVRSLWFALLVAGSAIAALAGLAAAWRAFHRQLQLSEAKSNFVSSVSHELRAPIASIRLMAESLAHGKVTEEPRRKEYFGFISQECRRLSSLIENVLDFSRIDQDRKRYEFEPADLAALVRTTLKVMEPYATERGVELVARIQEGFDLAPAVDARALQQALVNLVDNALKHSPAGKQVLVGLESAAPTTEPGAVQLWVEDYGEGIPAAEHERIFERFYRRGSELRRETSGVGIGLSIVKHVVESHGGRIHVRSAPGQGSRFTIELPLNRDAATLTAGKPT